MHTNIQNIGSIDKNMSLFIYLFIYLFVYLFIYLFTYLFIYLFIYLFNFFPYYNSEKNKKEII